MEAEQVIRRLHQHRTWVNRNLLAASSELSDEQLRESFAIGQGSIWKSLTHLYAAEYVWLESLTGNAEAVVPGDLPGKLPGNQLGEGGLTDFDDLKMKWSALEQRWESYLASLTAQQLDEIAYRKSTSSGAGKVWGTCHADVLLHVCTHAQYTSAQVVNMLRQVGAHKFPDVMLISLSRQEAS